MAAVEKDLFVEQGATFRFPFQWCSPAAGNTLAPRDLTGWTFRMQARRKQSATPIIIEANTENSKIVVGTDPSDDIMGNPTPDPTNGWVTIHLTAEDTEILNVATCRYDLEAVAPNDDVYRLLQGVIRVSPNITQGVGEPEVTP